MAATPISSLTPVPEFPRLRTPCGSESPPTPHPATCQDFSFNFSILAPNALRADMVQKTSSLSNNPLMRVVPAVSAPKMRARCDMDLSPGTLIVPERLREGAAHS